jgi:hypothetical protein
VLKIRSAQFDMFRGAEVQKFEDWMRDHLWRCFEQQCQSLGDPSVREKIRYGIQRAAVYGMTDRREVSMYIDLMVVFGDDFDTDIQLPWAVEILKKQRPPRMKIFALHSAAKNHLRHPAPGQAVKPAAPTGRVRRRRISFVVTARDEAPDTLKKTLDGLLETSSGHRTEILLIDDGSSAPALLARPGLTIIRNEASCGVAQSRRMGAAFASGEVLVFCDAHMQFAPDWLERLLEHVDTGAFLCAAWWDYELTHAVCWGGEYRWCGERNYQAGKTPGFTFRHLTRYPGPGAVDVPLALGACYMVLRDSYDRMGGFSPYFRIWGKCEQDVSARAWITGVGAKCVTDAHVGHLSRKKFPYPVSFSDIEFNQVAMVRTTFEEATVNAIELLIQPLPTEVQSWVDRMNFAEWRERVQSQRRMSDAEFFQRFVPSVPEAVLAAALAR